LIKSPNKRHFLKYFLVPIILLSGLAKTYAQVFPQVNSPVQMEINAREEQKKLGSYYFNNREYDKAAEIYKVLFDENPSHLYYTYYFYSLVALEEYEEAEKAVKTMIKNSSRPVRYEIDKGYLLQLQDRYDKAYKIYDDIIETLPADKGSIMEAANAFLSRQVYDYAIKTYEEGSKLLNNAEPFREDLARIYEITGNYKEMIGEYLDLLQEDPMRMDYVQGRLQNVLNKDSDDTIGEILREALLTKSQENPDDRNFSQMLLWLSIQRKDFEFALVQAKSIDKRFGEDGQQVFNLGNLALANDDYRAASDAFKYVMDKGTASPFYLEALTGNLQARFMSITSGMNTDPKEFSSLEKEYTKTLDEYGYNTRTIFLMRDLAHLQAFYLDQTDAAAGLLEKAVAMPGVNPNVNAQCKLELGDILLYQGSVWDASLLYSQVDKALKNEPLGSEAKLRNARLSYYIGEFDWAKAQLDVLKAATSKLIANDALELSLLISDNLDLDSNYIGLRYFSKAELLSYMNKDEEALRVLDSIKMLGLYHPLDDNVLYKKANIYIKLKEFDQADSLLARAVSDYPDDILADNALFKRAELQETVFHNSELAMELYQQVLTQYQGSLFVTEARKRFRNLRGDELPDGNASKNLLP